MLTNDNDTTTKPKVPVRRSSLKNRNQTPKFPLDILKGKAKRNSISWGQTDTFKFKENNPTLQETKNLAKKETDEAEEKHKKFLETRRRSVQNEFVPQKKMKEKSKELVEEEINNEELKKNMENNIKVGKEAKDEISEMSESNSSSSSGSDEDNSKSCSCSSCRKKRSMSESPSKESEKESKKKNKKEEKENNTKSKLRVKIKDEKEIIKKNKEKAEKENNNKKNIKFNVKIKEKKEEYNEDKDEKDNEDEQEVNNDEKEKENKQEIKVDKKIRLISYKEAKELDLDKVAYIALTDGSILIVRKDLKNINHEFSTKSIDILKSKNYISNKSNFSIKGINNEYDQALNNNQNLSQSNSINQIFKRPSFNRTLFQNDIQRQQQPTQNIYPKSEYSFNGQIFSNNISLQNQNYSKNVQRINKINTNNTYFYNRYNPSSSTLFKPNRNPNISKYFSSYKTPSSAYFDHRHSHSQCNLIQSNNPSLKQFIQVKNPQRQAERNKYKVIEVIPCNYCETDNNQMLDNSKYAEPIIYQEMNPSQTIISRNNHYIQQRSPNQNIIYSPIETNFSENNNYIFEQELNDCL